MKTGFNYVDTDEDVLWAEFWWMKHLGLKMVNMSGQLDLQSDKTNGNNGQNVGFIYIQVVTRPEL